MDLAELRRQVAVTVPEAGELLSLSRSAAYRAAERGEIPTIRVGRRLIVPVPRLLRMLEADPAGEQHDGVSQLA